MTGLGRTGSLNTHSKEQHFNANTYYVLGIANHHPVRETRSDHFPPAEEPGGTGSDGPLHGSSVFVVCTRKLGPPEKLGGSFQISEFFPH